MHHHNHRYHTIKNSKVRVEKLFFDRDSISFSSDALSSRNKSRLNKLSDPFICKNGEGKIIANAFSVNSRDGSHCPHEDGLFYALAEADPKDHKVIINIGVNKGYNIPTFFQFFLPFLSITNDLWYKVLNRLYKPPEPEFQLCGACGDCKESFDSYRAIPSFQQLLNQSHASHLDFLFADLNCQNILLIKEILIFLEHNEKRLQKYTSFLGFCAGVSKESSQISIVKCPPFNERCGVNITLGNTMERVTVPLITVDQMIEDYFTVASLSSTSNPQKEYFKQTSDDKKYQPFIDILLIDTEGYDPWVLEGAQQALRSRSVRVIIFEYCSAFPWITLKLQNVVNDLDGLGYDCHFEGKNRLWKLTGEECWSKEYEFYEWSNVICVRREDRWHEIFQNFVVRADRL